MKKHLKEIIVLIIIFASIVFGSYAYFYHRYIKPNLYTVAFQDVDGAIVGSPVHFMGVTIGHVRNFKIKNNLVIVEIIVTHPNVKIPHGATIKVEFSGMGGSRSMEVQPPSSNAELSESLTSDKPIRIADIFRFNKIYATSMMAFERDIKKVKAEEVEEAFKNIPSDYDFDSAENSMNKFENVIKNMNHKAEEVFSKEEKGNQMIEYATEFIKKIPYGKGDKSK